MHKPHGQRCSHTDDGHMRWPTKLPLCTLCERIAHNLDRRTHCPCTAVSQDWRTFPLHTNRISLSSGTHHNPALIRHETRASCMAHTWLHTWHTPGSRVPDH